MTKTVYQKLQKSGQSYLLNEKIWQNNVKPQIALPIITLLKDAFDRINKDKNLRDHA